MIEVVFQGSEVSGLRQMLEFDSLDHHSIRIGAGPEHSVGKIWRMFQVFRQATLHQFLRNCYLSMR